MVFFRHVVDGIYLGEYVICVQCDVCDVTTMPDDAYTMPNAVYTMAIPRADPCPFSFPFTYFITHSFETARDRPLLDRYNVRGVLTVGSIPDEPHPDVRIATSTSPSSHVAIAL